MISEASYNYLLDNRAKLYKNYKDCYVVIKDGRFAAAYISEDAVEANAPKYGPDILIVYIADEGIKEYALKG